MENFIGEQPNKMQIANENAVQINNSNLNCNNCGKIEACGGEESSFNAVVSAVKLEAGKLSEAENGQVEPDYSSEVESIFGKSEYEGEGENAGTNANASEGGGIKALESNLQNGSPYGKFKTANDLLNAYNNLQAEFTRRCQALKKMQNLNLNGKLNLAEEDATNLNKTLSSNTQNSVKQGEVAHDNINMYDTADSVKVPRYQMADFDKQLANFLSENEGAKIYAKEIGEEILADRALFLQSAYDRVLAKKYKAPNELANDEKFIANYIINNEKVLKTIMQGFKASKEELPRIITNHNGAMAQALPSGVKTIKEAGELAYRLFD